MWWDNPLTIYGCVLALLGGESFRAEAVEMDMIQLLGLGLSTSYFPVKQGHFAMSGHLSLHTCDLVTDMT